MIPSIVLVGAGNVATHLGHALRAGGFPLRQVYSRTAARAEALGTALAAPPIHQLPDIDPAADLYILAVSDAAIGPAAEALARYLPADSLVVHTSGATPATVLAPFFRRHGVVYPLQTFTADRPVDLAEVPFCIYAAGPADEDVLRRLAARLSRSVHRIDDEQRAALHVAAVFVNNFVNGLYQAGYDILSREQLPFDLLLPLIRETAAKVDDQPPAAIQTGPARRGDHLTAERHLRYLEKFPQYRNLYRELTRLINPGMLTSEP